MTFNASGGVSIQSDAKRGPSKRALVCSYAVGVALSLLTQLGVVMQMQRGSKVYVSLLWAPLYPVQLYITDVCPRLALALHFPMRDATATALGVVISSILFGLIVPALVGLAQSRNTLARYIGFAALAFLTLMALVWFPFPNLL
jgi:hypothetical protein